MWARIHLIPALQAEEDRDQVRRYLADKAREKELLGTETRVYHSDRCVTESLKRAHDCANVACIDLFDQHSRSHQSTRRNKVSRINLNVHIKRKLKVGETMHSTAVLCRNVRQIKLYFISVHNAIAVSHCLAIIVEI